MEMTIRTESIEERRTRMFALVEDYIQSGQSQLEYIKQAGVSKSTFSSWVKKYRESKQEASVSSKDKFLSIKVHQTETTPALELELPNGVKLKFFHPVDPRLVQELIA